MYLDELSWERLDEGRAYGDLSALFGMREEEIRTAVIVDGQRSPLRFWGTAALCRYDVRSRFSERVFDPVLALRIPKATAEANPPDVAAGTADARAPAPPEEWELLLLNGSSARIYETIDRCGIDLTDQTVVDYLKFFCFVVHGDEGSFSLIERLGDLLPRKPAGPLANGDRALEYLRDVIRPVSLEPGWGADRPFLLDATVKYGTALFAARFSVNAKGEPNMVVDSPLMEEAPSDLDLGIPSLDVAAVRAEIHERSTWVAINPSVQPTSQEIRWALAEFIEHGPGISDPQFAASEWRQIFSSLPDLIRIERWAQRFIRAGEILRISFATTAGAAHSCTFLWQRLLRSWPALIPLSGRAHNLFAYLDALGLEAALEAYAGSWEQLAAFSTTEYPEELASSTGDAGSGPNQPLRRDVYLSFVDLPVEYQQRACEAIARWTARDERLLFLLSVGDHVLEHLPPELRKAGQPKLDFLRVWSRAVSNVEVPKTPVSAQIRFATRPDSFGDGSAGVELLCLGVPPHQVLRYLDSWAPPTAPTAFSQLPKLLADRITLAVLDDISRHYMATQWRATIITRVAESGDKMALARENPEQLRQIKDLAKQLRQRLPRGNPSDESEDFPLVFDRLKSEPRETQNRHVELFLVERRQSPPVGGQDQSDGQLDEYFLSADFVLVASGPVGVARVIRQHLESWRAPQIAMPARMSAPTIGPDPAQTLPQQSRRRFQSLVLGARPESRPSMTSEKIAEMLATERALDLKGVIVKGNLRICRQAPAGEVAEEDLITRQISETLRYVRVENCQIDGYLSLDGVTVQGECTLRNVSIAGVLSLCRATFEKNIQLEHVSTTNATAVAFMIRNTSVGGGLSLQACCFEGDVEVNYLEAGYLWIWLVRAISFSIWRTVIRPGSISTFQSILDPPAQMEPFGLLCEGYFQMNAVKVEGILNLADISISGQLVLDHLEVQGGLSIGGNGSSPSRVGGASKIIASNIAGGLQVHKCLLDKLYLGQARISTFTFGGSHGEANLLGHSAVCADIEVFETTVVGEVRCQAVEVLHTVRIERCHLGHVDFDGQLGSENEGQRFLLPTRINEGVEIRGSRIDGSVQFLASQIRRNTERVQPAFELSSSTVGKHLMFWTGRYCENINAFSIAEALNNRDLIPGIETFQEAGLAYNSKGILTRFMLPSWLVTPQDPGKKNEKPKEFSGSPRGRLDHSDRERVRLRKTAARVATLVDGRVRINQCHIEGDVRLSDLHAKHDIDLIELQVSGNVRADSEDVRHGPWKEEWGRIMAADERGMDPTTECRALILKNCKIGGRVDLTGLIAGIEDSDAATTSNATTKNDDPSVWICGTAVAESVDLVDSEAAVHRGDDRARPGRALADRHEHHGPPRSYARLGGRLDVSGSTFGTFRLSGSHWNTRPRKTSDAPPDRFLRALTANNDVEEPEPLFKGHAATFTTLEFVHRLPPDDFGRPPIDLLDATVKAWGFSRWHQKTGLGSFLAQMLARTKPRERVYFQVESYLREVGHGDWSKKIARDAVWRQRCKDVCDALPNATRLKRLLRQKRYVATSDETTLGLRQVYPIVRTLGSALLALFVCAILPWRGGARTQRPRIRLPVWLLASVPVLLSFSAFRHRQWFPASFVLLPLPFLFPEVRACGLLFASVANRLVTGNFTSPGRAFFLWVVLYCFATMFFWDIDHLDISSLYKKNFYEDAAAESSINGAPNTSNLQRQQLEEWHASLAAGDSRPLATTSADGNSLVCRDRRRADSASPVATPPAVAVARYRGRPNKVTLDVCKTLSDWDFAHTFLFATRFMIPVAPSVFDEIDIDNTTSAARAAQPMLDCAAVPRESLLDRCCTIYGRAWSPQIFEFGHLHAWPVPWVALFIRVMSSVLLTLLGATLASRFSHRSS